MFLTDIPHALLRRWYVALFGLLCTAGLAFAALSVTPKDYTVISETLLLPPSTSVPAGENPYLSLGGLNAVGDILARAMQDDGATSAMASAGFSSEITFVRDQNSAAPIMLLTVVGKSEADALRDTTIALNQLPVTLKAVQARTNVPEGSYVTQTVIVRPDHATPSGKSQIRTVVVAVVAGIVLTLLLTALTDRALTRQSRRRHGSSRRQPARTPRLRPAATPAAGDRPRDASARRIPRGVVAASPADEGHSRPSPTVGSDRVTDHSKESSTGASTGTHESAIGPSMGSSARKDDGVDGARSAFVRSPG